MPPLKNEANCVIGEGSVFEGRFYVNGSILIEGKFQGDIKTDDQLTVGPDRQGAAPTSSPGRSPWPAP